MKIETKRFVFDISVWTTSLCLALGVLIHDAVAGSKVPTTLHAQWMTECGSCHVAYPPQMLDLPSWRRLMSGLDKHFGSDASLDEPARRELLTYLERYSGGRGSGRYAAADGRITSTAWFRDAHDEVPATAWRHPSVRSAANCAACHPGAEAGDYAERNLRLPRGIRMMED
jgi:Dihaem cytochrome c